MPAESLKTEKSDSDPKPMAAWPTLMKSPPDKGEELMKAKKNVMETKPVVVESKIKTCICSPTSHAGSFRCHLHRASATQNSFCRSAAKSTGMGNSTLNKLNSKLQGGQPILSRFGRASSLKPKPIPESTLPGK